MGDLTYNTTESFTIGVAPPVGIVPTAYQDTAIRVQTSNGGYWDVPLTVYIDTNQHANVVFAVRDDVGQAVANAQVTITSTTPPFAAQTGTTDQHGLFVGTVSVGVPFNYHVSATAHADAIGSCTAQDERSQTVPVTLTVQAISTTWTVVPTTIPDVYDLKLQLTYHVDTPVPKLASDILAFDFTPDPLNPVVRCCST